MPASSTHAPWGAVALFAALCAGCERLAGSRFASDLGPEGAGASAETGGSLGPHTPVLLAAAFLLPPAAVLVALPGALTARVEQRLGTGRDHQPEVVESPARVLAAAEGASGDFPGPGRWWESGSQSYAAPGWVTHG